MARFPDSPRREAIASSLPAADPHASRPGTSRALIIEGDCFISSLVEEYLVALRFEVIKLSPAEPLCLDMENIELIVLDVNPRRDRENPVLNQLASRYPGVAVLAISANYCSFSSECAGELARRLGVAKVLPKPFSCEVFSNTVRALVPAHE